MEWRRHLRVAALLLSSIGCSKTDAVGGLVVVMHADGTLQPAPDTLHVDVGPHEGGAPYEDVNYVLDDSHTLPVNFAVDSNGDPNASVSIVVWLSNSAVRTPLETQRYMVDAIPTDRFVQLDIVFGAACAPHASSDGGTGAACCPAGCAWASGTCVCDAGTLPTYPFDAGESVSRPTRVAEAGSPQDATVYRGKDSAVATSESDAGSCRTGAVQCTDAGIPQRCASNGQWQDQSACISGWTYCFQGGCVTLPPSCAGVDYSLCASDEVLGGAFLRGEDALHEDAGAPATISGFRLDTFEITVARFRAFVDQVTLGGGLADAGAGTHVHLAGGRGLNGGGDAGVHETGWDPSWNAMFSAQAAQWDANLRCAPSATWSASINVNDGDPINCVTWYEAYAFCIWDGGFLPSEAEWNYAAAGGSAQRLYPWGSTDPGTSSEYADYGSLYPMSTGLTAATSINIAPVGSFPMGAGAFGQQDLAGNVAEWTLDLYDPTYPTPCNDCAALSPDGQRVYRGGGFDRGLRYLYTSSRVPADPASRYPDVGVRCARVP
jgi:formylglycine-generating enzyme required for sulfatase activity